MNIPIVKCCYTIKRVQIFVDEYSRQNAENIKKISRIYPIKIEMNNGEILYVMTFKTYDTWNEGKTYRLFGTESIYKSDYLIRHKEKNKNKQKA